MKTITTEYQVGTKIDLNAVTVPTASQLVYGGIKRTRMLLKLEARMALYDALHRTHYRRTYNAILARDRNAAFEAKIGLVRTK